MLKHETKKYATLSPFYLPTEISTYVCVCGFVCVFFLYSLANFYGGLISFLSFLFIMSFGSIQETLGKAAEVLGTENQDLYDIFMGLLTRNGHQDR